MDFNLSPEEESFRDEVRAFLDENLPPKDERDFAAVAEFQRKVRERRWVGFSWPEEVGGGGGSVMQQVILKEEMAKRNAPSLGSCFMGLAWVGPGIIEYGTEEQKQRFIPDILDSKYQWCTGYSEPDSGSDLASLKCRCELQGDEYVVNGQKIWTSLAMWAKWMILLVRTETDVEVKHDGITCLLVEVDTPGITVRPIKNMAGNAIFAEVFFDDVRVPVENRLGEEGQGWRVTVSALAHERSSISEVYGLTRTLARIRELAKTCQRGGRPAEEDPHLRRRIAQADMRIEAMRLNGMRFLTKQLKGEPLGAETSINKLLRAQLEIEFGELALEIEGSLSVLGKGDEACPEDGHWQHVSLNWPELVIGGGTPNIQKNIIAERVLGLPKD
ncbi:MAG: acyl-CoA dehydrogenase family protein [Deltaproteobacteria bacterium]|nr:acyl-CoA dehydrogenase family protein [Deltaproteobacteria bacterium]MBW2362900.1 acyl-CoA dehydrogenase family protein [Deltaproteobacteria bacterium]